MTRQSASPQRPKPPRSPSPAPPRIGRGMVFPDMDRTMHSPSPTLPFDARSLSGVPGRRLGAWIFDGALIFGATAMVAALNPFIGVIIWPLLATMIAFVYRTATLAMFSATPGMQLFGITLRAGNGVALDLPLAAAHTVAYLVAVAIFPLQLLSVALMATGSQGQGLGDLLLGTVMLRRNS